MSSTSHDPTAKSNCANMFLHMQRQAHTHTHSIFHCYSLCYIPYCILLCKKHRFRYFMNSKGTFYEQKTLFVIIQATKMSLCDSIAILSQNVTQNCPTAPDLHEHKNSASHSTYCGASRFLCSHKLNDTRQFLCPGTCLVISNTMKLPVIETITLYCFCSTASLDGKSSLESKRNTMVVL